MNVCVLHGRMARDAEIRTSQAGKAFARFTVAVDRAAKNGEKREADFISCVAFGRTAEMIERYFPKGKEILLEGHIQTGSYEKDGIKKYTVDVLVDRVEFCGSKGDGGRQEKQEEQLSVPF